MESDLAHWVLTSPQSLGDDVAGLRTPDAATALVIDGYATSDGQSFDYPPFQAGRQDATFMLLPADVGARVFERMAAYVGSRKSLAENLEQENEVLAARWDLPDGQVAVLVVDGGGCENAQDTFEKLLGFEHLQLHSSDKAVIAPRFDARKLLADDRLVFGPDARQALSDLLATPAATPAPTRPRR